MNYEQKIDDWYAKFEHSMHSTVLSIIAKIAVAYFKDSFKKHAWMGGSMATLITQICCQKSKRKRAYFNSFRYFTAFYKNIPATIRKD